MSCIWHARLIFLTVIYCFIGFLSFYGIALGEFSGKRHSDGRQIERVNFQRKTTLVIRVNNLAPATGSLRIALYSSKENYEKKTFPVRTKVVPVRSETVTVRFSGLDPGWYAVMFFS